MRHWIGGGLAAVLALALFFGAGWGVAQMSALPAEGLTMTSNRGLAALSVLTCVGLLLGILVTVPWISPLAAGLPGMALLGWTALLGLSGTLAVSLIPMGTEPSGAGLHILLANGTAALLGFAMVFPMFVPSRWWGGSRYDPNERKDRGSAEDGREPAGVGLRVRERVGERLNKRWGKRGGEGAWDRAGERGGERMDERGGERERPGKPRRRGRRPPPPPGLLEP
jgi:hypothetical protein